MNASSAAIHDVHHHWVNEAGYIDRLLGTMDRLSIERIGLIALGDLMPDLFVLHPPRTKAVNNHDLASLVRQHPDRFWGWGFIRLGSHQETDVQQLADLGMAGLKFHMPLQPYSDPSYFPVYEQADRLGLPCLFHTGPVYPPAPMPGKGIRSENYRPIHLEPIAHEFPSLKMIIAHLGVCWQEEATTLCRMCPHIYADLSGRVDGWRSSKPIEWFRQMFYWPDAHKKILFGSDVHADEMANAVTDHRRILDGLGWNEAGIADVLGGNARRLFGGVA